MTEKAGILERIAHWATEWSGSSVAFVLAVGGIVVWLVSGPIFNYSDTWQLVINTGTTIVTFLMVFLIQRAQNKESLAVQTKLNEIVSAVQGASNQLIDIEDLDEADIRRLHKRYIALAERTKLNGESDRSQPDDEDNNHPADKEDAEKEVELDRK